jgi:hypothetical protein
MKTTSFRRGVAIRGGQGYAGSMPPRLRTTTLALAAAVLAACAPAASASAPYSATPGPQRADASFALSYEGGGTYRTTFHGEPPNPDGNKDDRNDAHDSSRQAWAVRFSDGVEIPTCAPADDPCAGVSGISGASGPTTITGRVNHRHVDGIYPELDRTVKCRLRKSPSRHRTLDAAVNVRYLPESQSFAVSASNPVATAISLFPTQCPKQGDSIDRILDFYAVPGFSFADGYGPERWFASREVVIPAAVFHDSKRIRIPLRNTPAGTPPRRCAVRDPSFERCRTGGAWRGVLTLKSRPSPENDTVRGARALAKFATPPSGSSYHGTTGGTRKVDLMLSGRSIELMAFDFKCRSVTGRTSLNGIKLRKTTRGWRFSTRTHGSVSYSDDKPDQNARIDVSGRFSRTAKSIRGRLRVKTPRCGDTRAFDWSARLSRR